MPVKKYQYNFSAGASQLAVTLNATERYSGIAVTMDISRQDGTPLQAVDVDAVKSIKAYLKQGESAINPRPRLEFKEPLASQQRTLQVLVLCAGEHQSNEEYHANEVAHAIQALGGVSILARSDAAQKR